jgi:hypothetical protein
MDFMHYHLSDVRIFGLFMVLDEFNREGPDFSLCSRHFGPMLKS